MRRSRLAVCTIALAGVVVTTGGGVVAAPPQDTVAPFAVPDTPERYAVSDTTIVERIKAPGADLWLETWLPVRGNGDAPPTRVPVVLMQSPYAMAGRTANSGFVLRDELVRRGYAYAVLHARGTGSSGGCAGGSAAETANDAALAIERLAAARWSTGKVGMFGLSSPGIDALKTGSFRSDLRALKAIVAGGVFDLHDFVALDGVPRYLNEPPVTSVAVLNYGLTPYSSPWDIAFWGEPPEEVVAMRTQPGGLVAPEHVAERPGCHVTTVPDWAGRDAGDFSPYYSDRAFKHRVPQIKAATLLFGGFGDAVAPPWSTVALFDRIRAEKAGFFGSFGHQPVPRPDFTAIVIAWLDHHLRDAENGVDAWPVAQVQDSAGRWRAEADWPRTGGPMAQLALGPGGVLGADAPTGESTYRETLVPFDRDSGLLPPGSDAVFTTAPLSGDLHLTGQPVLDAYIRLEDRDDAHVAVELIARAADGTEITSVYGARSMRHLDATPDGVFAQETGRPAPIGQTIRVAVRISPLDVIVPAGGYLQVRVSGSARVFRGVPIFEDPTQPSGAAATVTVVHDCVAGPTTLRFAMPRQESTFIRYGSPGSDLGGVEVHAAPSRDGGGMASQPVCGDAATAIAPAHADPYPYRWP